MLIFHAEVNSEALMNQPAMQTSISFEPSDFLDMLSTRTFMDGIDVLREFKKVLRARIAQKIREMSASFQGQYGMIPMMPFHIAGEVSVNYDSALQALEALAATGKAEQKVSKLGIPEFRRLP